MFSLPYSLAFMGLISQLSNGTMGMLRLPSSFSFPSISLGRDTTYGISILLTRLSWWKYTPGRPGILWLGHPVFTHDSCGDGRLSRVSMPAFITLILPRTPVESVFLAFNVALMLHQLWWRLMLQRNVSFRSFHNTFVTCCLRFMPPSLMTMQNSLPVVDLPFRVRLFIRTGSAKRCFIMSIRL